MKKKLLSILLTTAMVATMATGCSSGGSQTSSATDTKSTTTETTSTASSTAAATTDSSSSSTSTDGTIDGHQIYVYLVSKGFQHQYWQAVYKGAQEEAKTLGVKMEMVGPNTESDIQDQVQMLNNAINSKPDAIGLAALDTQSCLDSINTAMQANIPIIGFDSGVPDAPTGAVYANASTDNYAAGELAAENTYKLIESKVTGATKTVRIGVMSQDATSESIVNRGKGFIDKMKSLCEAAGKTVSVEGNDKFAAKKEGANVIIDVAVPASVTAELSAIDGQNLLNKSDTIAVYASNQHSGEALVNANANLNKLGADGIIGVAFDSGKVIKDAVKSGVLAGAVTQDPVSIGKKTVELAVKAVRGEQISDVDTGCKWYTSANMDDADIAANLYD